MANQEVVVLSAVRSAIGSYGGSLKDIEPCELGGMVMKEAIARSGVDAKAIEYITVGNTMPTDKRYPYVPRVASVLAGCDEENSVAMAVNRLCSSGLQAIVTTAQQIMLGECDYGIGGGVEVMSRAAFMLPALRWGARMNATEAYDGMVSVITDPFGVGHMGITAENVAEKFGITRQMQDECALTSQTRAAAAIQAGHFKSQIVDIALQTRKGEVIFNVDENPRETSMEKLAKMKTAFKKVVTVTAGNASSLNDGAAFFVLASAAAAKAGGQKPIARLVSYAVAGVPHEIMGIGPVPAVKKALQKAGLSLDQMDVIEANEAFAAQACAVAQELGLDPAKTNPNGGAIALGHPVGCTGAFIATKAVHELQRIQGKYALVTMCIGGGQGIAAIFERL
ncbi:MAG: beta-ketothiolase BktB [Rhodocyclaceae bacterium]|nr:beta-ketothiolase BktB [Rhodocyclaceae bacterium]